MEQSESEETGETRTVVTTVAMLEEKFVLLLYFLLLTFISQYLFASLAMSTKFSYAQSHTVNSM